jgi:sugar diacid utilization regulator
MGKEVHEADDFDVDALYSEFLEVIINGGGYRGIAELLAQKLQASILIEDEFFRVLARFLYDIPTFSNIQKRNGIKYWKPQRVDPKIINYVRLTQSTGRPVELPELPEYGISKPRVVFPIIIKYKFKGALHVFMKDLDRYQMRVTRAALHNLTVLETCRQVQVDLEEEIKKSLILNLIANDKVEGNNIHREKQILGFELSREAVLAVVQIKTAPGIRQIEEVFRSLISDLDINASATAISDERAILLFQSADDSTLETAVINDLFHVIFDALKMIFTECQVKIGVGRRCLKAQDYKIAYNEACKALTFHCSNSGHEEGVVYYHSLNLMEILLQAGNEHTLPVFVRSILGKLNDYGVAHNINMIESLEYYLNDNCCIQSAARKLFIHPNSLRYRLEKAEKISGLDLTDNDTKLEIQLAIKLYRYYGESILKG